MKSHWNCSKFANIIRGTSKPYALGVMEWRQWRKDAREKHPFRYWIAEDFLHYMQTIIDWPKDTYRRVRAYIKNRWVYKTHQLTASSSDIKPGTWCDVGDRFLPCLFNELVNYVEIEVACFWDKDLKKACNTPKYWVSLCKVWRCPEAGIAYLKYMSEKKEHPDPSYKEILELYRWWKEIRPNRVDPYVQAGYNEYVVAYGLPLGEITTNKQKDILHNIFNSVEEIEAGYVKEDEEMMIRLIKIRNNLWT